MNPTMSDAHVKEGAFVSPCHSALLWEGEGFARWPTQSDASVSSHCAGLIHSTAHTPWWGGFGSPWQRALSRPARSKASARTGPPGATQHTDGLPLESADRGVMFVLLALAPCARGPDPDRLTLVYTMRGSRSLQKRSEVVFKQNYQNVLIVGKRLCTDVCKRSFDAW